MKYLGIDYGEKNIGLATSDDDGRLAFPLKVLRNSEQSINDIKEICLKENIEALVLGESLDLNGKPNPIMKEIEVFKKKLEEEIKKPVFFELEFYTTKQSSHIQGRNEMTDASAAAIILQSFLDKSR